MKDKFVCVHIGARAHYLIPKALQDNGKLALLITDTWISSSLTRNILAKSPVRLLRSLSSRYSSAIPNGNVREFGLRFIAQELRLRLQKKLGWSLILARNKIFQENAATIFSGTDPSCAVLGISYTSLEVFKIAKKRGQKTILFQIDPGIREEEIVSQITENVSGKYVTTWQKVPDAYWADWLEECNLSDVIMVNSTWSRECLLQQGIAEKKIFVLPLPFDVGEKHRAFVRKYVPEFTAERPLKCLFLGTLTLRKGIHLVLEAARQLEGLPVEFILVGQSELHESVLRGPNVSYKGVATREETDKFYREADLFLFPTLSDGFGLTQLEAMAWKVPVVASSRCGTVVVNNVNGFELERCESNEIVDVIKTVLAHPDKLKQLSENSFNTLEAFTVEKFSNGLSALI